MECDPSIKSIIVKIDSEDHAYIVEELDDQTLVIKENMLSTLKARLDDVRAPNTTSTATNLTHEIGSQRNATAGR